MVDMDVGLLKSLRSKDFDSKSSIIFAHSYHQLLAPCLSFSEWSSIFLEVLIIFIQCSQNLIR